jgi:hypothetical protein
MKNLTLIIVFFLISLNGFGQSLTDHLVLHLPFSGNADDSSGSGYIVTNSGATLAPDRFGNSNLAYYFDGSSTMTIDAAQNLPDFDSSGYTVSFWVKHDTTGDYEGTPLSYGGSGGYKFQYNTVVNYIIYLKNKYVQYKVANGSDDNTTILRLDKWNMLTLTYLNGVRKIYVNGSLTSEGNIAASNITADLILGDGLACWMDDIRIYNRCLSNVEVAELSGLSGVVKAAKLKMWAYADFERNTLIPTKHGYSWGTYEGSIPSCYATVIENPVKEGANTSDYCGVTVSFPSAANFNTLLSSKYEYRFQTSYDDMIDRHHILQWKYLIPDSAIVKADSVLWFKISQIHPYSGAPVDCNEETSDGCVAWNGGGIFNDCDIYIADWDYTRKDTRTTFAWRYRALPDSAKVYYTVDIGKWMTFTYDIYWTKDRTKGYWRLYKNGELLSSRDNVRTLANISETSTGLEWKTGQYTRWNDWIDNEIDSLPVYYDDLELYIDPENDGISIYDICPECFNNSTAIEHHAQGELTDEIVIFPNPVNDYLNIYGETVPASITFYSSDGRKLKYVENTRVVNVSDLISGIYIVFVNMQESFSIKKIIKE